MSKENVTVIYGTDREYIESRSEKRYPRKRLSEMLEIAATLESKRMQLASHMMPPNDPFLIALDKSIEAMDAAITEYNAKHPL